MASKRDVYGPCLFCCFSASSMPLRLSCMLDLNARRKDTHSVRILLIFERLALRWKVWAPLSFMCLFDAEEAGSYSLYPSPEDQQKECIAMRRQTC